MARRTLLNYVYDTLREAKGQATFLEAIQAIQDAIQTIDSKGNWEFLSARGALMTQVPYQTGTVAYGGSDQVTVTLSGGTWDTSWKYKELKIPARRLAQRVASIDSPTQLTLQDPLPVGVTSTSSSYLLFQARYALPSDCEPGRDLIIKAPIGYGVLGDGVMVKRERMRHEMRSNEYRVTGPIEWYTDDDVDTTANVPTIRFWPAPSVSLDLRLTYYRSMRIPSDTTQYIDIPATFERLVILLATSLIMKRKEMQGWVGKAAEAGQMLGDLYDRHAASAAYDGEPEIDTGAEGNRPVGFDNRLYTR